MSRLKLSNLFPIVLITWEDAETDHGWEEHDAIGGDLPVAYTIGFLVKETKGYYLIASTVTDDSNNGRFKIPKQMVVGIKHL